jgi:hypothetical protein
MQRDLDLVRRILLHLEASGTEGRSWSGFGGAGGGENDPAAVHYHVQLMNDAGLIQADELVPGQWWPERMTWAGHEFLDAARNDALWSEARRRIERRVGSAPFEVLRELLLQLARERLATKSETQPKRKKKATKATARRSR